MLLNPYLSPVNVWWQLRILFNHVVGNVVHVPLEALALQLLLQGQLVGDVTHVQVTSKRLAGVEILFVLVVKPNLDHTLVILKIGYIIFRFVKS